MRTHVRYAELVTVEPNRFVSPCHDCGSPAPNAKLAHSGIPGVYWPMCDQCWEKLSDDEKRAVDDERKKPFAF